MSGDPDHNDNPTDNSNENDQTRTFTINFTGDVMLGRLIDQLLPQHVSNPLEADIATHFIERFPSTLGNYTHRSPWGNTLNLFHTSDLNIVNLETSMTTVPTPWPNKAFNYRMHPANVAVLHEARVDYVSLANNHTVDFGTEGLVETVWTLKKTAKKSEKTEKGMMIPRSEQSTRTRMKRNPIAFAGAGETTVECFRPAVLKLPRPHDDTTTGGIGETIPLSKANSEISSLQNQYTIHVYSASDHPKDWAVVPTFNLIDYSPATRQKLKSLLTTDAYKKPQWMAEGKETSTSQDADTKDTPSTTATAGTGGSDGEEYTLHPDLKIFSVHWGPNYAWRPDEETIQSLAHFLIDECGVDIIHGHSSHHVQGVEIYKGKLIIYGCGDFVDDYAVNDAFRNDLGALWRVRLRESHGHDGGGGEGGKTRLELDKLEIFPTRIERFQTNLLPVEDADHDWVREKITMLSEELGTSVRRELGEKGQIVVDLKT